MISLTNQHFVTRARARQAGFNLIELMVSIALGLFLLAGVVGIVLTMRKSFSTQDGMTQTQESQRFMLSVLNTTIHNAGYFPDPLNITRLSAFTVPAVANPDGTTFKVGQFITGKTGTASDTITLRFMTASGDGIMNCNGDTNTSGAPAVYTNSFAVNAAGQLTCAVTLNGGAPATPAVLVDHISSMRIMYAVESAEEGTVDSYLTAQQVQAGDLWGKVAAVKIRFTMKDLVRSTPSTPMNMPSPLLHTISMMNQ